MIVVVAVLLNALNVQGQAPRFVIHASALVWRNAEHVMEQARFWNPPPLPEAVLSAVASVRKTVDHVGEEAIIDVMPLVVRKETWNAQPAAPQASCVTRPTYI